MRRVKLFFLFLALASLAGCLSTTTRPIVYVSLPSTNGIEAFRLDNNTGLLTKVVGTPFFAGNSPSSMLLDPSGRFLYVVNRGEADISLYHVNNKSGDLTEIMPRTVTGLSPTALTLNTTTGFLFVANQGGDSISIYSMNSSNGTLTPAKSSPFFLGTNSNPVALAVTPSGKFLYAASSNLACVFTLAVDSQGGLQQLPDSPFTLGTAPKALALSQSGNFLYTANTAGTVSGLLVGSTGSLTSIPGSPFTVGLNTNPSSVIVHPSDKFLYTTNSGSNNVSVYTIDPTLGSLTELPSSPFAAGRQPISGAIDSTGNFLFVCNEGGRTVSQLMINPQTGGLTTIAIGVPTPSPPVAIVIGN